MWALNFTNKLHLLFFFFFFLSKQFCFLSQVTPLSFAQAHHNNDLFETCSSVFYSSSHTFGLDHLKACALVKDTLGRMSGPTSHTPQSEQLEPATPCDAVYRPPPAAAAQLMWALSVQHFSFFLCYCLPLPHSTGPKLYFKLLSRKTD